MSVDKLQEKIRKCKNPSVIDFGILEEHIPPYILEDAGSFLEAYGRFCRELLEGLKGEIPAVRFSLNAFVLHGGDGFTVLADTLCYAKDCGYYVFLDIPGALSAQEAESTAKQLFSEACVLQFDGLITTAYIGSDALRPFLPKLKEWEKTLICVVRTSNKTAPELQDLLTGARLMHMANVDVINRYTDALTGRFGYSQLAIMAGASSADSLCAIRTKYKNIFMLLDGYDYPNANAKNCSYAFDKFGHGAIACAGTSVTAAWQTEESDGKDYVAAAVLAAQRMKKNLTRYVTVL